MLYKRFLPFVKNYKVVPFYRAIPQGEYNAIKIFKALRHISNHCFILESLEDVQENGRYTFIGYDPILEISCKNGLLNMKNGTETEIITDDPNKYIQKILLENKSPKLYELPHFTGGLVGYFSYDYIKYSEKKLKLKKEKQFKDMDLMLFDKVIVVDSYKKLIYLIINIKTENLIENCNEANRQLNKIQNIISQEKDNSIAPLKLTSDFKPLFDKNGYCNMVEKVKSHIKEGDIFQAVLSNRFEAKAHGALFGTYLILRKTNPSPYMFYFSSNSVEIAGASPETLVKLRGDKLSTFPLAGTRKRGENKTEDMALQEELLHDTKELAEHNMLVDLGRNDLGKISKFGTVKVEKYLSIVRFSHVMHIASTVTGEILENKNAVDAISAVLPAGTLSGAPKIRACEIIHELEGDNRGIYGGAVGYIALNGDMDTCIAIRIAYKKDGKVYVRSGAGIVADSVPENEYEECLNKAKVVFEALQTASKVKNDTSY